MATRIIWPFCPDMESPPLFPQDMREREGTCVDQKNSIQKTQDSSRMPAAINRIGRHPGRQPLGRHRRSGGRQSQRFI